MNNYLTQKNILIISPQEWGNMLLAKHHYAIELASMGNTVFFLNPSSDKTNKISVTPTKYANLYLVDFKVWMPLRLKFHMNWLYQLSMKFYINKILSSLKCSIDIVWSFDLGNYYSLKYFSANSFKLFNPVDEPLNTDAIKSALGADLIISVTKEIIDKYKKVYPYIPSFVINHGLCDEFLKHDTIYTDNINTTLQIGLSGNFLRTDIDTEVLLQIIKINANCFFNFYGSYKLKDSNISGLISPESKVFIDTLLLQPNVKMHGILNTKDLADELNKMDAFLICYDVIKDQSKGTNYHKVLEYLSTGKVVISNNITAYKGKDDLITMVEERNNLGLCNLFTDVIENLNNYNSIEKQKIRKNFALNNTYSKQIERISQLILSINK